MENGPPRRRRQRGRPRVQFGGQFHRLLSDHQRVRHAADAPIWADRLAAVPVGDLRRVTRNERHPVCGHPQGRGDHLGPDGLVTLPRRGGTGAHRHLPGGVHLCRTRRCPPARRPARRRRRSPHREGVRRFPTLFLVPADLGETDQVHRLAQCGGVVARVVDGAGGRGEGEIPDEVRQPHLDRVEACRCGVGVDRSLDGVCRLRSPAPR